MWNGMRVIYRSTTSHPLLKCWARPLHLSRQCCPGSRFLLSKSDIPSLSEVSINRIPLLHLVNSSSPFASRVQWRYVSGSTADDDGAKPPAKPSLYQRFKSMYKDYWYVLIPVHVVTSCMWFGAFFYTAQSGFDVAGALEFLNLGDEIMEKIRHSANSTAGHITLSYLLYKIFTPLRYTVTLGGTTYAINYLTARGLIKKLPNKAELKKIMVEHKDSLKDRKDTFKKELVDKFSPSKKSNDP